MSIETDTVKFFYEWRERLLTKEKSHRRDYDIYLIDKILSDLEEKKGDIV